MCAVTVRCAQLTERQRGLLDRWLPRAGVAHDHSWGLVGTTVLEVVHDDARFIVKAGDENDHHLARELRAHRTWLEPWTSTGRAPRLVHADEAAKLLVTCFLPGTLVAGSDDEFVPDTYRQAGQLLAQLHQQSAVADEDYEARANAKALWWLEEPHRIAPDVAARLRSTVESWPSPATILVPTHGDWQPRNWLIHAGTAPALEAAFIEGYGGDPREPAAWRRNWIREAIGTAVWAYRGETSPSRGRDTG